MRKYDNILPANHLRATFEMQIAVTVQGRFMEELFVKMIYSLLQHILDLRYRLHYNDALWRK